MSKSYKIEIGQRIKEIRASMNMTQKQFCLFFGPVIRTPTSLSMIENGENAPPVELFSLLAGKGVNLNWVFMGRGPMYISGEGVYVPPGASRKEVKMFHQLHKILKEENLEKIKTLEGLLNVIAPIEEVDDLIEGAA